MSRTLPFAALALGLALTLAPAPAARADGPADDAKALAVKVTAAGAALFDARDAKALAQTYADDARLEIYMKEESGSISTDIKVGRAEIETYYANHFQGEPAPHARNTIDHARRVGKDLLVFSGVFEPNTEAANPLKLAFTQVRIRRGDAWKIVCLQLFIAADK